ncbi:MAG: ABC transporter ATP-binding protein [Verrucomicrobiae bacterium]|nr:ABC transporter ATP-binding protein [Verrucomicrobiae bacterium]
MLEIENLHVRYGAIHALRGVSLEVRSGEIAALIGANGAGKSTLLKAVSGLIRPSEGRMRFAGTQELGRLASCELVRQGISMVPEGRAIFSNLTVIENLEVGAYLRRDSEVKKDREWIWELFPRLRDRQRQSAATLSGGEQQMLAIGRALMSRPRLLLLDEPSLGLAPLMVQTIFRTIRQINGKGASILLVEQNAHMALQVAHRGYVLQTGEMVLSGTGPELMETEQVKRFYLGEA